MPDDIPTYLWGDTIRLRMEVEHEENLVAVWAIFRKEGETFEFTLRLRTSFNLRLMEWHGKRRISEACLEGEVRLDTLPGDYELVAVRGTSVGAQSAQGLEFDIPEGVRLRVAEPPPASRPRVAFYEFQPPS